MCQGQKSSKMTCSLAYTLFSQRGHLGAAGRLPRFMFPKPHEVKKCGSLVKLRGCMQKDFALLPPLTAQPSASPGARRPECVRVSRLRARAADGRLRRRGSNTGSIPPSSHGLITVKGFENSSPHTCRFWAQFGGHCHSFSSA
jgi:hypothetical protein